MKKNKKSGNPNAANAQGAKKAKAQPVISKPSKAANISVTTAKVSAADKENKKAQKALTKRPPKQLPKQEETMPADKRHTDKSSPKRPFFKLHGKKANKRDNAVTDEIEESGDDLTDDNDGTQADISLAQNAKERILSANPVLVKAIALVPILGAATSLKNGIMLSAAMFLTIVVLNLILYPLYRLIPHGYRFAACFLAAGAVITPVYALANYLAPSVASQCSVYLPLIAVCALPMIEKRHYGKKFGIFKTERDAALDGVGFAFAAIVFSIIREIIGNGTLYDRALPYISQIKFSFALVPAGAFLLLGVLIALMRQIHGVHDDNGGH